MKKLFIYILFMFLAGNGIGFKVDCVAGSIIRFIKLKIGFFQNLVIGIFLKAPNNRIQAAFILLAIQWRIEQAC